MLQHNYFQKYVFFRNAFKENVYAGHTMQNRLTWLNTKLKILTALDMNLKFRFSIK